MNVYLGANEIDPQTLGSLNLEGIYRGGDVVWTSGDKYELITSNGNYGTIWHNLTEGTFVISRHPASDGNPNTWALSQYYPIIIIADHDYGVDPTDDMELGTYTDGDGNTVKQILAGAKNAVTTYTPGSISVSGYHVPQIEEYRELIRLAAPILASGNFQDKDGMNLFKVLRFSLSSQDRQNAIANYQYNGQWGYAGTWFYWTDTYGEINDGDVCTASCSLSSSVFSAYDDSKFSSLFFGISSPSYTHPEGAMRLFRNIEQTKFAPYLSMGYCSHTNINTFYNDIIYSGVDTGVLGYYVSPLGTNNLYFPAGIEYCSTGINICAKFTGYSSFPYYWATSIMAEEALVEGDDMRLKPTDYGTSTFSRYSDIGFQLNFPNSLYLYVGGQDINLSYPNQRPSAYNDFIKYKNPYIYVGLTPNNVYITVADGAIPSASTSIGLDVTIDVSNNSDYQNLYPKLLAKKFVHIKGIEDTTNSGTKVATAVNFGMPLSLFKQEAFVGGYTPWYDGTWRTFYEDYAEIL